MAKNHSTKDKKKQIIDVNNWEEAEEIIWQKIQAGENFRDISKLKFRIGDKIEGVNVSKIYNVKKKHASKATLNSGYNQNKDHEMIKVFKLLKKGISPSDIVIETGDTDLVNRGLEMYVKFNNLEMIPKKTKNLLFSEASTISPCKTYDDLFAVLEWGTEAILTVKKLAFICKGCGRKFKLGEDEIEFLQKSYEENDWTCNGCLAKQAQFSN